MRSTKENAYYSSLAGDPAGSVLDAMRFHGLGAILDWLATTTGLDLIKLVHRYNIGELVFITGLFIVLLTVF